MLGLSNDKDKLTDKARLYGPALERVQSAAVPRNMMIMELGANRIVLPYEDALVIQQHLTKAETFDESYSKPTRISPVKNDAVRFRLLSHEEYTDIKVATLLDCDTKDITAMRLAIESLTPKEDQ